jgi:antitoxin (DNA-binding transcriptional repressor) of toxin-antitoxin stability system
MSFMSPSISFRELADGADDVLDRIAAHTGGVVISYDGDDVARITPLSAEERAWRKALIAEGEDPDAPENAMEPRREDPDVGTAPESAAHGDEPATSDEHHDSAYAI